MLRQRPLSVFRRVQASIRSLLAAILACLLTQFRDCASWDSAGTHNSACGEPLGVLSVEAIDPQNTKKISALPFAAYEYLIGLVVGAVVGLCCIPPLFVGRGQVIGVFE